jgi:hypothetical protein
MFFRSNREDYLVLGKTGPFWFFPCYKIPPKDRRDHMHIVGTTGKGKSKKTSRNFQKPIGQEFGWVDFANYATKKEIYLALARYI